MKKLFGLFLLLLLPLSFIHATDNFSNPDDSRLLPDTWTNGASETIAWNTSISPAKLVLFRNTGSGNVFVKNIGIPTIGAKSFLWIVDVSSPGSGYKIAVCPKVDTTAGYASCSYSDSFNIVGSAADTAVSSIVPTLTVSPATIQPGGSATLSWNCSSSENISSSEKCYCLGSLTGGTGTLILPGSKIVSPAQTTTYTLQCRDKTISNSSYISKTATLTVSSAPVVSDLKIVLKANNLEQDLTVQSGATVNLSWQRVGTGGFTTCRLGSQPGDPAWDGVGTNVSGSKAVSPGVTTSYSIICWDASGTNYTDNLKVTVENQAGEIPPPVVTPTSNDTDKDGVIDTQDKCPNTTSGAKVATNGCPKRFSGFVCNRDNPEKPICKLNFGSGDTQSSCRADCKPKKSCSETSFASIAMSLSAPQYTLISEKDFRGWASQDPYDPSGDIQEIREEMGKDQRCFVVNNETRNYTETGSRALNVLLTTQLPTPFTFFVLNPIDITSVPIKYKAVGGHATVLTSIAKTDFGYSLTIVDSNSDADGSPKKMSYDCVYRETKILYPTGVPGQTTEEIGDILCMYNFSQRDEDGNLVEGWFASYPKIVSSNVTGGQDIAGTPDLIKARQNYCQSVAGRKNPSFCQRNVAKWLEDNYPIISNQGTRWSEAGMCAGWSTFLLRVAYLGDFTGTDCFHEEEKSNLTSLQMGRSYLANSWQAISSPFDFLRDWFKAPK